jgi:hypothetical protein
MQSALLGLKDIHPRLKAFKHRLLKEHGKMYMVDFYSWSKYRWTNEAMDILAVPNCIS